ncbi:hypothetical protein QA601_17485 [Chitinispirillales bacterium ANBcel5]|uniref:hypothetical protein n=1 Tax=Cellulosispirillum alkaliphilum TaxID=3039283 RepID=UPI002A4F0842|nr:hypothetical protein [Chitinispirillales bacterium ANBcel5]
MGNRYIAGFDSSSVPVRALGAYLFNKEFPALGLQPSLVSRPAARLMLFLNKLSPSLREKLYSAAPISEALPRRMLKEDIATRSAEYFVKQYPERFFPAVSIGASNGAMMNICALLGIPFLPQNMLIPVRRVKKDPHDVMGEFEFSKTWGTTLLKANPELALHLIIDPTHDFLMSHSIAYFRAKRIKLGKVYKQYLLKVLKPGGAILVNDCTLKWPVTSIDTNHYFQFGGHGSLTPDDFFHNNPNTAEFRKHYGNAATKWNPPKPDLNAAEAEWGLNTELLDDIRQFCTKHGFRLIRVSYEEPEDLSPLAADLYRDWYRSRQIDTGRLIVQSFVLQEPFWTVRTGSIPFWLVFPTIASFNKVQDYIQSHGPFKEIGVSLLSFGVTPPGLVAGPMWKRLFKKTSKRGFFIGVEESEFPLDFASLQRYHLDFGKQIRSRYPVFGKLSMEQFERFLTGAESQYSVSVSVEQ